MANGASSRRISEAEDLPAGEAVPDASPPDAAGGEPGPIVALGELIADEKGEVVLFNDSGLRTLTIAADAAIVGRGQVDRHVTASGDDVSGWRYIAFENGIKLYFHPRLHVSVASERD